MFRNAIERLIRPGEQAFAHCDIPCGIYDPKEAQLAAESVEKMMTMIADLGEAQSLEHLNSFVRYVQVKEEHAEKVKHQVRIIWGDYFKPPHLEQFPDLHTKVWDIMKTAGACKQGVNLDDAKRLRAEVDEFAEMFWKTKA
jgi:nickel superoxide dismutase